MPGYGQLPDFCGASSRDGHQGIAEQPLDHILFHDAVAAVNLYGLTGRPCRGFTGELLGQCGFGLASYVLISHPAHTIGQQTGNLQVRVNICNVSLNHLQSGNGFAIEDTFIGELDRLLQNGIENSQSHACHSGTTGFHNIPNGDVHPLPFMTQEVFLGNLAILKDEFPRDGPTEADLILFPPQLCPGEVSFYDKGRESSRSCLSRFATHALASPRVVAFHPVTRSEPSMTGASPGYAA